MARITGDEDDNDLIGGGAADVIRGNGGNDTLTGGGGADQLIGGDGDDTLFGGIGRDTMVGGAGNDVIFTGSPSSANGIVIDEIWSGGDGTDRLVLGENETFARFILDAAAGIEVLDLSAARYVGINGVPGSQGDDLFDLSGVRSFIGTPVFNLRDGNDSFLGSGLAETVDGGFGDDTVLASAGADSINGSFGIDTVDYSASTRGVNVDRSAGTATGGLAEGDRLSSIEVVFGTAKADRLKAGGSFEHTLFGGDGADVIEVVSNLVLDPGGAFYEGFDQGFGGDGHDRMSALGEGHTLFGGRGNDTLSGQGSFFGGDGNDTFQTNSVLIAEFMNGGRGVDTVDLSNVPFNNRRIDLAGDRISVIGDDRPQFTQRLQNIENAIGGGGSDLLIGTSGANRLDGWRGNDTLTGAAGGDVFVFRAGDGGADLVTDFGRGADRLALDRGLWEGNLTAQQVVNRFASDTGADVLFDFGDGGSIRLQGLASLAGLAERIDIL